MIIKIKLILILLIEITCNKINADVLEGVDYAKNNHKSKKWEAKEKEISLFRASIEKIIIIA